MPLGYVSLEMTSSYSASKAIGKGGFCVVKLQTREIFGFILVYNFRDGFLNLILFYLYSLMFLESIKKINNEP